MNEDVANEQIAPVRLLVELGLADPEDVRSVEPLTGGVASDIHVVDLGDRKVCTKFALEKLRVERDWRVPVTRNRAEYAWLEFAGRVVPGSAPRVLGRLDALDGFAMEMLEGPDVRNWKASLMSGHGTDGEAARVARCLVQFHAASSCRDFDRAGFENMPLFSSIRLEPYIESTAELLPEVGDRLVALSDALKRSEACLIHGDVSPKNILFRGNHPVFLDAECATMGDPVFDVAFCLNHLMLKSVHLPMRAPGLAREASAFWSNYRSGLAWEDRDAFERRAASLLPALMICRVLGKSPVEYLSSHAQQQVLDIAIPLVRAPVASLNEVFQLVTDIREVERDEHH